MVPQSLDQQTSHIAFRVEISALLLQRRSVLLGLPDILLLYFAEMCN